LASSIRRMISSRSSWIASVFTTTPPRQGATSIPAVASPPSAFFRSSPGVVQPNCLRQNCLVRHILHLASGKDKRTAGARRGPYPTEIPANPAWCIRPSRRAGRIALCRPRNCCRQCKRSSDSVLPQPMATRCTASVPAIERAARGRNSMPRGKSTPRDAVNRRERDPVTADHRWLDDDRVLFGLPQWRKGVRNRYWVFRGGREGEACFPGPGDGQSRRTRAGRRTGSHVGHCGGRRPAPLPFARRWRAPPTPASPARKTWTGLFPSDAQKDFAPLGRNTGLVYFARTNQGI